MPRRVRVVHGADGRTWTVQSRLEWADPVAEEDFEHDVGGGRVGAVVMIFVLFVLLLSFVLLTPATVVVPGWLTLALGLLVLFFPVRWLVRRPWTLTAETPGVPAAEKPAERWVGSVRGYFTAKYETARVRRHLRYYAVPDRDGDGPLQPVA
jgi:hypothetical protein